MRKYKIRMNCSSFHDVVVEAKNKNDAIDEAHRVCQCPQNGMEFGEFLPVEKDEELTGE